MKHEMKWLVGQGMKW